ncbi:DUF3565 domain-containing protein [Silvibacterium dinghuense]|uniref:DUF3565 domain-containing protein n=1 Tax=Silvibacterium dinghuense TaxID=1560006 RepID=A0A4Q1SH13_9BACT|nr:DUF3565 domain-containing protein [Silvibacterium dinghuense]RXS96623.1 DUF3565 domain-containing protein [Silvibacterium dinghuense]
MPASTQPGKPQPIHGFHQDEHGDWVAELACGHGQHVRHRPPWELRPWVSTEEGRHAQLGLILYCVRCLEPEDSPSTK